MQSFQSTFIIFCILITTISFSFAFPGGSFSSLAGFHHLSGYTFASRTLPPPPPGLLLPNLEDGDERKTLVLDLDGTLVNTTREFNLMKQDPLPSFLLENSIFDEDTHYVYVRPGVKEFLDEMSMLFEIVIWTAGSRGVGEVLR